MLGQIQYEKDTINLMIKLYCKGKHQKAELCSECKEIVEYAHRKLENCKFGDEKPTCEKCSVHCYQKNQRQKIREVMRYAGPRMIWHYPLKAILHFLR